MSCRLLEKFPLNNFPESVDSNSSKTRYVSDTIAVEPAFVGVS